MTHVPALLQILLYSTAAFLFSFALTPHFLKYLQRYSMKKNIREHASGGGIATLFRALHIKKEGTPTMGGILIWGTVLFIILFTRLLSYFGILESSLLQRGEVYLPLFTLVTMGLLGAIDDYLNIKEIGKNKGLQVLPKFFFLITFSVIGAFWFYFKLGYTSIHIPSVGDFDIGLWYIPLFILVITATSNAVNITDGLDGLAGGLLLIAFASFGVLAYAKGLTSLTLFCTVVCGALLAFLWNNVPPAKFYMGDTGSLALGATLGVIAMMVDSVLILLVIGFIFVIETLSVIIQITSKKLFGKKVFAIAPLHHHFEHQGWSESQIVMRFWIIGSLFAIVGLILGLIGLGD